LIYGNLVVAADDGVLKTAQATIVFVVDENNIAKASKIKHLELRLLKISRSANKFFCHLVF
jgi:hypothetical protein